MRRIDSNLPNIRPLKARRRELRNQPTVAEAVLWKHLRKQALGKKFRRQYSIGRYVVDFYCVQSRLAIELDGAPHYSLLRQEYEAQRTALLESHGVRILRFENRIVFENLEAVLETIREGLARTDSEAISPP